jgi:DNA polymerase
MNTEFTATELLSLISETRERVSYVQEMGVVGIESESLQVPETTKQGLGALRSNQSSSVASSSSVGSSPSVNANVLEQAEKPGLQLPKIQTLPEAGLFGDLRPPAELLSQSTESFEQIWADLGDCTRCPLHQCRTNIVHTEGNRRARLMFVGEAPGADEDAQARPFVGRAGQLLTKIIEAVGLKREEVLIGNVNRCRPPGNRPPTQEEAAMCKPFLLREIAAVQPEVIVVLGNTAMRNLLETREGITKLRGRFQDFKGIKIMPTFHPAYLLRDPSKKRETWEDLKKVRDYLDSTAKRVPIN